MSADQRENSGTLGKAKRRDTDKWPEYTGSLNVAGVVYWLSAWVKTGPDGSKFFSLAVKPKEENQASKPASAPELPEDDTVPF